MLLLTVTLNPSIDLWMEVDRWEYGEPLRARNERRMAGGKGINVARMLTLLRHPARSLVIGDREFAALARQEIPTVDALYPGGPTRINVHVQEVDPETREKGRLLKVNGAGAPVTDAILRQFREMLRRSLGGVRGLVLAGSLPPGAPPTTYVDFVGVGLEAKVPVFLDACGAPLGEVLRARGVAPTVLKVNCREGEEALGVEGGDVPLAELAARLLRDLPAQAVCLTDGERGAVLVERGPNGQPMQYEARPRRVLDGEVVGAGDAFLAGLAEGWTEGLRGTTLLERAMACGMARAVAPEGVFARLEDVDADPDCTSK